MRGADRTARSTRSRGVEATVNFATETAIDRLRLIGSRARASCRRRREGSAITRTRVRSTITKSTITTRRQLVSSSRSFSPCACIDGDDPAASVRGLGLGVARSCHTGCLLEWRAVPPSGTSERATWGGDDGTRSSPIGTLAAWGLSAAVLVFAVNADGTSRSRPSSPLLILLGRFFETRAKRRSGAAIRALLELGAKEARVLRGGEEMLVPVEQLSVDDLFVFDLARRSQPTVSLSRAPQQSIIDANRGACPG